MSSKSYVRYCLDHLRSRYSELVAEDPQQWAARVDSCHAKLRRFDADVVEVACQRAFERYPQKFPTAGQLASLAIGVDVERKAAVTTAEKLRRQELEDREINAYVDELRNQVIPHDVREQEKWVDEGETKAEKTARWWEAQSKQLSLDPTQASPADVTKQRFRELHRIMDDIGNWPARPKPRESQAPEAELEVEPAAPPPPPPPAVDDCPV